MEDDMEIRNLISFVQVAEMNSFTKAAKALDYSQSTISFQIRQLEAELDCLLFERINHTITLTEKGRELLEYAQQICRLTEAFKQNLNDVREPDGHVHIVTSDSICQAMLTQNYADFYSRYPGISLKFTAGDTVDMFRMLDHNEADVMFTLDNHVFQKDYIIAKEERITTHFVVGANSKYAGCGALSIRDIADAPFILTEKGMGYRRVLDETLARQSLEIQPVLEAGRTDLITKLLEAGNAISFLPDFVTQKKVEEGKLVYLDVTDVEVDIWKQLIYHRNKWISKSLDVFLKYVMEIEFDT